LQSGSSWINQTKAIALLLAKKGDYIQERLRAEAFRFNLTNIRGRGLLLTFDVPKEMGKEIVNKALAKGLLLNSPQPSSIRLMPPLIVKKGPVDEMIVILRATMEEVLGRSDEDRGRMLQSCDTCLASA
jgi:acetylornithine/N-succinyldiaminopimelate aminotransferase